MYVQCTESKGDYRFRCCLSSQGKIPELISFNPSVFSSTLQTREKKKLERPPDFLAHRGSLFAAFPLFPFCLWSFPIRNGNDSWEAWKYEESESGNGSKCLILNQVRFSQNKILETERINEALSYTIAYI